MQHVTKTASEEFGLIIAALLFLFVVNGNGNNGQKRKTTKDIAVKAHSLLHIKICKFPLVVIFKLCHGKFHMLVIDEDGKVTIEAFWMPHAIKAIFCFLRKEWFAAPIADRLANES